MSGHDASRRTQTRIPQTWAVLQASTGVNRLAPALRAGPSFRYDVRNARPDNKRLNLTKPNRGCAAIERLRRLAVGRCLARAVRAGRLSMLSAAPHHRPSSCLPHAPCGRVSEGFQRWPQQIIASRPDIDEFEHNMSTAATTTTDPDHDNVDPTHPCPRAPRHRRLRLCRRRRPSAMSSTTPPVE